MAVRRRNVAVTQAEWNSRLLLYSMRVRHAVPVTPGLPPEQGGLLATRSRRALFAEGLLSTGSDAATQFLALYLVVLGATAAQVGLLATVLGLAGFLALLPAAWIARRTASPKRTVLLGSGWSSRVLLLSMAAVPFFLPATQAVLVLIGLGALRALSTSIVQPTWLSLFASVVPEPMRAAYNVRRTLAMSAVSMAVIPAAGWSIHHVSGVEGFQLVFALCALTGLAGSFIFARIQEPPRAAVQGRGLDYRAVIADRPFRRFLLSVLFLQTASSMAGPFVVIYMVRALEANSAQIGMLATADAFAALAGQLLMTVLIRRWSSRLLFAAALFCVPAVPLLWLSISAPWQAVFPSFFSGVAWAIWHLAAFNLLLQYAPADRIPEYSSAHQLTALGAGFLGPLAGSLLIAHIGLAGVFVLSAAGRLLAIPLFLAPLPAVPVPAWVAWVRALGPRAAANAPLASWELRIALARVSAEPL